MHEDLPTFENLHTMNLNELTQVAEQIRKFLISTISKTGGHIGANLGVIELTIALHHVFDLNNDKIIFDTGHQGYTHKILTGRTHLFPTLNSFGGMNRFLSRSESKHDVIDATHAGTALSTALGIAKAFKLDGIHDNVVAIIGDGTFVEGLTFEGLNFAANSDLKLIIVMNDNGMAIAPNIGGILHLTSGRNWQIKCKNFFEGLGIKYHPVPNGNDLCTLIKAFRIVKKLNNPIIVHVKTEKGKGLPYAKSHPYKMHFSMPFDPQTGKGASPTISGKTYATVATDELLQILRKDKDVIVITPATPYASSLDECLKEFPERVFDVGMAEQHSVSMACGLALSGKKPVICFQTTFMQRAFDQLIHDASFMNLPITILGVRSGFSGYDGPTHHGLYDIPYLRSFPNMQLIYPINSENLREVISERLKHPKGPMLVLYPYEPIPIPEPTAGKLENGLSVVTEGKDGIILCLGNRLSTAHEINAILKSKHGKNFGIACISHIKPLPVTRILELCSSINYIITLEESTLPGGFGSLICEVLNDNSVNASVFRSGVQDRFVPAGNKKECSKECGLEAEQVVSHVLSRWPNLR